MSKSKQLNEIPFLFLRSLFSLFFMLQSTGDYSLESQILFVCLFVSDFVCKLFSYSWSLVYIQAHPVSKMSCHSYDGCHLRFQLIRKVIAKFWTKVLFTLYLINLINFGDEGHLVKRFLFWEILSNFYF